MTTIPEDRTTSNSANEHAQDHNTFAAAYNRQVVFLPATALHAHTGGPEVAVQNSEVPAWQLDATGEEAVATVFQVPDDWSTLDVDLIWAKTNTGTGDVVFEVRGLAIAAGDGIDTPPLLGSLTAEVATSAHTVQSSRLVSGHSVDPGTPQLIVVARIGDDAADTYGDDIGLIGIRLLKAS